MAITDKKGINVTSGFKLISPAPIDARYVVEDETELQSIIDSGAAYKGLRVWVNSLSKVYEYNGTAFVLEKNADTITDWTISGYTTTFEYTWELNAFQTRTSSYTYNRENKSLFNVVNETYLESITSKNKIAVMARVIEDAISHIKELEESGVGGSGGVTEEKVVEIVDEKVGDIDSVLDEINGGGTTSGGTSSGQEVEIEFSVAKSDTDGKYDLTQITPFTNWYKVKDARIVMKGTGDYLLDISSRLPNINGLFQQTTHEPMVFSFCGMNTYSGSTPSYSAFGYTSGTGNFTYEVTGDFIYQVDMMLELGVTTCTLIVTI